MQGFGINTTLSQKLDIALRRQLSAYRRKVAAGQANTCDRMVLQFMIKRRDPYVRVFRKYNIINCNSIEEKGKGIMLREYTN